MGEDKDSESAYQTVFTVNRLYWPFVSITHSQTNAHTHKQKHKHKHTHTHTHTHTNLIAVSQLHTPPPSLADVPNMPVLWGVVF